ncbi:MAG: helix-turn-helix transcriptional regulator [Candidatus Moranbacteria bacterium]|jgi:DNA-binding Xre family transcriptional regulator|nr:helix-turn-helix transcriptional regulator [Candidatus Moranbacteria bacterium]
MITYKIKDMRRKRGISQGELSKESGIARATISKLENGAEIDIRISTILALSKVLKCSPSKLFE